MHICIYKLYHPTNPQLLRHKATVSTFTRSTWTSPWKRPRKTTPKRRSNTPGSRCVWHGPPGSGAAAIADFGVISRWICHDFGHEIWWFYWPCCVNSNNDNMSKMNILVVILTGKLVCNGGKVKRYLWQCNNLLWNIDFSLGKKNVSNGDWG